MVTKEDLVKLLDKYSDEDVLFIKYSNDNELECSICSSIEIIDMANDLADYSSEDTESIIDIDVALQYLSEVREDIHFTSIEI